MRSTAFLMLAACATGAACAGGEHRDTTHKVFVECSDVWCYGTASEQTFNYTIGVPGGGMSFATQVRCLWPDQAERDFVMVVPAESQTDGCFAEAPTPTPP